MLPSLELLTSIERAVALNGHTDFDARAYQAGSLLRIDVGRTHGHQRRRWAVLAEQADGLWSAEVWQAGFECYESVGLAPSAEAAMYLALGSKAVPLEVDVCLP